MERAVLHLSVRSGQAVRHRMHLVERPHTEVATPLLRLQPRRLLPADRMPFLRTRVRPIIQLLAVEAVSEELLHTAVLLEVRLLATCGRQLLLRINPILAHQVIPGSQLLLHIMQHLARAMAQRIWAHLLPRPQKQPPHQHLLHGTVSILLTAHRRVKQILGHLRNRIAGLRTTARRRQLRRQLTFRLRRQRQTQLGTCTQRRHPLHRHLRHTHQRQLPLAAILGSSSAMYQSCENSLHDVPPTMLHEY